MGWPEPSRLLLSSHHHVAAPTKPVAGLHAGVGDPGRGPRRRNAVGSGAEDPDLANQPPSTRAIQIAMMSGAVERCATVQERLIRHKTAAQHGDVAQLAERLLCNSLGSCAVLTCGNAASCAPSASKSGALASALARRDLTTRQRQIAEPTSSGCQRRLAAMHLELAPRSAV